MGSSPRPRPPTTCPFRFSSRSSDSGSWPWPAASWPCAPVFPHWRASLSASVDRSRATAASAVVLGAALAGVALRGRRRNRARAHHHRRGGHRARGRSTGGGGAPSRGARRSRFRPAARLRRPGGVHGALRHLVGRTRGELRGDGADAELPLRLRRRSRAGPARARPARDRARRRAPRPPWPHAPTPWPRGSGRPPLPPTSCPTASARPSSTGTPWARRPRWPFPGFCGLVLAGAAACSPGRWPTRGWASRFWPSCSLSRAARWPRLPSARCCGSSSSPSACAACPCSWPRPRGRDGGSVGAGARRLLEDPPAPGLQGERGRRLRPAGASDGRGAPARGPGGERRAGAHGAADARFAAAWARPRWPGGVPDPARRRHLGGHERPRPGRLDQRPRGRAGERDGHGAGPGRRPAHRRLVHPREVLARGRPRLLRPAS